MKFIFMLMFSLACTHKSSAPKELEGFTEVSRRPLQIKDARGEEVHYKKDAWQVTVRMIGPVDAASFDKAVALREFELAQPFRAERSPYAGALTDTVQCPASFKPRLKRENGPPPAWRAETSATARRATACSEKDFALKGVEVIYFCEQKKALVTVTAYFPKSDSAYPEGTWFANPRCMD